MTKVADLLAELVRMKTQQGGGDERAFCEHLAPLLRARGADHVEVGEGKRTDGSPGAWVFATWGTPRRVINAHVDTVPANAGWSRDPWTPAIEGGKLFGLGSADTKGAIAATLVALDDTRPKNFGALFSGDEEAGSRILTQFLSRPQPSGIEEVVVCEPTKRVAGIAHRGVLSQKALASGPGGHSSLADHLPKPIARLARLAVALDDSALRRMHDGPAGMTGTCLNIASLTGGIAFNVIAARAELEWSLRPYPGFDRASWEHELAGLTEGLAIETTIDHPPFAARAGSALPALLAPFADRVGPLDFWTEAALYAEHGIDAVVIGPGDIAQAHAADEWVALEDLDWAVEMLRAAM